MMVEISPYNKFLNSNKWFKGTNGDHCKEGEFLKRGDTVAVYGFPVTDSKHGYNPEIHPAQQIWFKQKQKTTIDKSSFFLMFLQDASLRFGSWVKSPVYGQFLIAFKVKTRLGGKSLDEPLTMNISIAHREDLVTQNYPAYTTDCDDGYSHSLIVDGNKILTVNEDQADMDDIGMGIKFVEITKLPGFIQGYVQVSMVLGDENTDPVGVCVLELEVIKAKDKLRAPVTSKEN
jgi:hypothetical protein